MKGRISRQESLHKKPWPLSPLAPTAIAAQLHYSRQAGGGKSQIYIDKGGVLCAAGSEKFKDITSIMSMCTEEERSKYGSGKAEYLGVQVPLACRDGGGM